MPQPDCYISVVIPLYNSATTLPRAVSSVLHQTVDHTEVLIVDDGSEDGSLSVACSIASADARVRVIPLPANKGKPHAMNRAISEARGKWIGVLDADDWYEPNRLARLVNAGETHRADLVADNQRFWDAGAGAAVRTALPIAYKDTALTKHEFIEG